MLVRYLCWWANEQKCIVKAMELTNKSIHVIYLFSVSSPLEDKLQESKEFDHLIFTASSLEQSFIKYFLNECYFLILRHINTYIKAGPTQQDKPKVLGPLLHVSIMSHCITKLNVSYIWLLFFTDTNESSRVWHMHSIVFLFPL